LIKALAGADEIIGRAFSKGYAAQGVGSRSWDGATIGQMALSTPKAHKQRYRIA
jgi:hypothetical protein